MKFLPLGPQVLLGFRYSEVGFRYSATLVSILLLFEYQIYYPKDFGLYLNFFDVSVTETSDFVDEDLGPKDFHPRSPVL